MTTIYKTYI